MPEETYCGPCTLEEALEAAEPCGGVKLAVSVPHGDFIAVKKMSAGSVGVRRVHRRSGHAGSVQGTGNWCGEEDYVPAQWRPA